MYKAEKIRRLLCYFKLNAIAKNLLYEKMQFDEYKIR